MKEQDLADLLLKSNRLKQAYRALHLVNKLLAETDPVMKQLTSDSLARELAASRHYITEQGVYHPVYLAFEFTQGILLRESQVRLVQQLVEALKLDQPALPAAQVHQLIMGQGKTTVVGPLLSLLLGSRSSLVVQVVPAALLTFSRSVMRECFSSPVFAKPVHTFEFNRASEITPSLAQKLRFARSSRSVLCSTPTAIKSFFLKLVEIAHILDNARVMGNQPMDEGESIRGALQRSVFGYSRVKRKTLNANEQAELESQLTRGMEMLRIFQTGKLLLDEIDLVCDPLKSELNHPVGVKLPLDFTYSSRKGVHGLRWQVPFHLLDAIFYAAAHMDTPRAQLGWSTMEDSREAQSLLNSLAEVIREGESRRLVQQQPHFVLLSRLCFIRRK